jgi:hypothetical protein
LTACLQPKPFDTVKKFADAYNRLDYNALVECMDPRITEMLTGIMGAFGGAVTGVDGFEDMAESLTPLMGDLMGNYATQYWDEQGVTCTMSVREISTVMNGDDSAKVTAEFTTEWSNGQKQTWQETMSMIRIDGVWYITIDLGLFGDLGGLFGL